MTASDPTATRRRRLPCSGRTAVAALAAVAAAAVGLLLTLGGDASHPQAHGSADAFRIAQPQNWKRLSPAQLADVASSPVAVLRRDDGKGIIVVRRAGPVRDSLDQLARSMSAELQKRTPDFRETTSRMATIRAGRAYLYAYMRRERGTVHSVVIVPAGRSSYVLNTVSPAASTDVAGEIGAIVTSFDI